MKRILSVDHAVDTASSLQVDRGTSVGFKNITRADDIGRTEPDDTVSIRVRRRNVDDLNAFTVKKPVQLVIVGEICIGDYSTTGAISFAFALGHHPIKNISVRNDLLTTVNRIEEIGPGDLPVSGRVLGIGARIDDVANERGRTGKIAQMESGCVRHSRKNIGGLFGCACINE